jgi:hypothetical protein
MNICCTDYAFHTACTADVTVTFPFVVRMPAAADAAITAISLLTIPAASDAAVKTAYASSASAQQAVPSYLWQHAYSMYGYGSYASNGEVRTASKVVPRIGAHGRSHEIVF